MGDEGYKGRLGWEAVWQEEERKRKWEGKWWKRRINVFSFSAPKRLSLKLKLFFLPIHTSAVTFIDCTTSNYELLFKIYPYTYSDVSVLPSVRLSETNANPNGHFLGPEGIEMLVDIISFYPSGF